MIKWSKQPMVAASNTEVAVGRSARAFGLDEKGSVAIVFALTSFVIMAMVGGAVDYGRAVTVRSQMQNALDAAVLAGARVWQTEQNLQLAEQATINYYNQNKPGGATSAVTKFTPNLVNNSISVEATSNLAAPFLSAAASIGNALAGTTTSTSAYTLKVRAQALLAAGGNGDSNLEISIMLDVTGSMSGTKITDLKAAAKDLIDIVVWNDQSKFTSKVALVPFAEAVHLGDTALANQVRGVAKTGSCTSNTSPCTAFTTNASPTSTQWKWGVPATWFRFTKTGSTSTQTNRLSQYCVTERTGTDKYTDTAPDTDARKVGPLYDNTSNSSNVNAREAANCTLVSSSGDMEVNTIQPLTNDKTALRRRIDKLTLANSTAGQIGTAWAWYMLSPNWAYLWPSANRPVAYHTEKTEKIAILMTDGEYNTAYCNGVLSANSDNNGSRINCNANNAISDTQADSMCAAMKNGTGITVYTVGFALGSNQTAINTLRSCASDPSKFYSAEDGDELRAAFRDIALQVAKLRLSQ